VLDQRGKRLRAAAGFATCSMPSYDRALWALRTWLDSGLALDESRSAWGIRISTSGSPRYDEKAVRA